jgi:acyl-CoA thioesterase FadM
MRWLRLIIGLISARFKTKLNLQSCSVINFRVWVTDVDASVMNHAALLTVFETGRLDYTIRVGFFRAARKNKWFFPLVSQSVQYLRPLKIFQKAQLTTRVLSVSGHYIYTEQIISRREKPIALCISKTKVKKGSETITPELIVSSLNAGLPPSGFQSVIEAFENEKKTLINLVQKD